MISINTPELTPEKVIQLYDDRDWKGKIVTVCKDVATCSHAHPVDRHNAIALWGMCIAAGHIDCDDKGCAMSDDYREESEWSKACADSLFDGLNGRPADYDKNVRDNLHEKLDTAKTLFETITGFKQALKQLKQLGPGKGKKGHGNVLSLVPNFDDDDKPN